MSLLTRLLIRSFHRACSTRSVEGVIRDRNLPLSTRLLLDSGLNCVTRLNCRKSLNQEDWKETRKDILKLDFLDEKNIDSAIANLCLTLNNKDAMLSYVEFLKSNNYEINLYLAGLYVSNFKEKSPITDSEKENICFMYDYIRKKYPILDGDSCKKFIFGLCLTDRWEESIELLDIMRQNSVKSSSSLTIIVASAFRSGKVDIGWKIMKEANKENIRVQAEVYMAYLQYCLNTFKDKIELEQNLLKMFKYLNETETILLEYILNDYLNVLKDLGYTISQTSVSRGGHCLKCSYQLPATNITKEEFDDLSNLFLEKVLVRDNVYYNSSPKEFKKFMRFLEKAKSYDIVIDGLNVASSSAMVSNTKQKASRLALVVEHFVSERKKIFLLGRYHMLKWNHMDFIRHNTQMFLVENSSEDDPHLLYATLYGGMKTCFLSGDLMRQHKVRLPQDMQKLFKRWQLSHQYQLEIPTTNIIPPVKFEAITHSCGNDWHIPYFSDTYTMNKDSYARAENWICLKKQKK